MSEKKEYIERGAVNNVISYVISRNPIDRSASIILSHMMKGLSSIPTVQSGVIVNGEWKRMQDLRENPTRYYRECSVCDNEPLKDEDGVDVLSDFCPYCGAHMERSVRDK